MMARVRSHARIGVTVLVAVCVSSAAVGEPAVSGVPSPTLTVTEADLARPLAEATVVRAALERHPSLLAARDRVQAVTLEADVGGRLPSPEASLDIWQVPVSRPYAVGESQMVMIALRQRFPPPGVLGARQQARRAEARVEQAALNDVARQVGRDVAHAFVDYAESAERSRVHDVHHDLARHVVLVAQARHAAGGPMTDATQAEVELAQTETERSGEQVRTAANATRLNALLLRSPSAPLGRPVIGEPATAVWGTEQLVREARAHRPEIAAASAQREAREFEALAAQREATIPSFGIGALYFAPVGTMPSHGVGLSLGVELPWLWGGARKRAQAQARYASAARHAIAAEGARTDLDVTTAEATVRTAAIRLQLLRDHSLPASRRAFDVAWTGFESNQTNLLTLLAARRAVVDTELDIIVARATLDHALIDLAAAVGAPVPTAPLGPLDEAHTIHGGK